jgi:nucleoid DNA-binding protein
MKREDLARKLARETRVSNAKAQDQVDTLVHRILKSLRAGRPVKLPGVGKLMARGR